LQYPKYQRWYEKNPMVKEAVEVWERFPPLLSRALAKHIYEITRDFAQYHLSRDTGGNPIQKALLSFKIMFKRRRWYDQDPIVRKTFNAMANLHHADLLIIAEQVIMLKTYIDRNMVDVKTMSEKQLDALIAKVCTQSSKKFF
jgi:hypothetical protein